MIFLEKYCGETKLDGWNQSFEKIDDLIRFMKKNKFIILGSGYRLEIKENPNFEIQEYLLKKEGK